MNIDFRPKMTKLLVEQRAFEQEPFTLVDVGALGGIQDHWQVFSDQLRVIAFEPNQDECAKLQESGDPRITYLPFALAGAEEERTLHIHRNPSSSSLFPYDRRFAERFIGPETTEVVARTTVNTTTLDNATRSIRDIDIIKLDAEGAEFEILSASDRVLSNAALLAIYTEVRFHKGLSGTPIFSEVDLFLRRYGFDLYDLSLGRTSRTALPYPLLYDYRADNDPKTLIFGGTISGQVLGGDALFCKDAISQKMELSPTKILKLACIFEVFTQVDSAAELILANRSRLQPIVDCDALLEALVPSVRKKVLPYREYVSRFQALDPIFRPTAGGRRNLEPIAFTYDALIVPAWEGQRKFLVGFLSSELYPGPLKGALKRIRRIDWSRPWREALRKRRQLARRIKKVKKSKRRAR